MPTPTGNIKVVIYALADPRNPKVPHYVGKTSQPLGRRLINHRCFYTQRPEHPLSIWVLELKKEGIRPIIFELESCQDAQTAKIRETCWINFFRPIGTLKNKSNGDGSLGLKGYVSPLNRAITAERNKNGWTSQMRSKIIPKLRDAMKPRMVSVFCETNGKTYECIADAEKELGLASKTIRYSFSNNCPVKGLQFRKTNYVNTV